MIAKYATEDSAPVVPDSDNIRKMKCRSVEAHIINTRDFVRHDSDKLAKIIVDLVASIKKTKGQ